MAVYRVDWPFIRDNLLDAEINPASKEIVLLPVGGRQILASVIGDRLHWQATYRTGDYDYSDWDTLEAIGAATIAGLLDGIMLQDLLAELDQIEAAILASSCCAPGEPVALDYEIIGPVAEAIDPSVTVGGALPTPFTTNPDYTNDAAGYLVYLCDAAHMAAAGITRSLTYLRFANTVDLFAVARQIVAPVVEWAIPGQVDDWLLLAWDEMYSLATAAGSWLLGVPSASEWDDIISLWDASVRQDVICAISHAGTDQGAADGVRTLLQSLHNSATWDAIWALYPFGRIMARVFQGAQSYVGPTQNCACDPPAVPIRTSALYPQTVVDGNSYTQGLWQGSGCWEAGAKFVLSSDGTTPVSVTLTAVSATKDTVCDGPVWTIRDINSQNIITGNLATIQAALPIADVHLVAHKTTTNDVISASWQEQ